MRELTKQAVKRITEKDADLKATFGDSSVILQVIELSIMDGQTSSKIKARMQLSDGVSKVMCMSSEQTWNKFVSTLDQISSDCVDL